MKILAIADAQHPALYSHLDVTRWRGVELLLGCGDLDGEYVDYLATSLGVPLIYVRGNHDAKGWQAYAELGDDVDCRLVNYKGLRIIGFAGAAWYGGRGLEYTEREMRLRVWRTFPRLWLARGVDIVISHAPPILKVDTAPAVEMTDRTLDVSSLAPRRYATPGEGLTDPAHRGFPAFNELMHRFRPRIWVHGHIHLNYARSARVRQIGSTLVANAYEYLLFHV